MLPTGDPPRRRRPTGAKVLLILGMITLASGITAIFLGQHHLRRNIDDIKLESSELRSHLTTSFSVPGAREVHLEPGPQVIYALDLADVGQTTNPNDSSDSFYEPPLDLTVTITDARGITVPTGPPGFRSVFDSFADAHAVHEVDILTAGTYRISAQPLADPPVDARSVPTVGIGPPTESLQKVLGAVGGGLAMLVGSLTALLGMLLAVGGLIWLLVGGRPSPPPLAPPGWSGGPSTYPSGPYPGAPQPGGYWSGPAAPGSYPPSPPPPPGANLPSAHPPAPPAPPIEPPTYPPYRP